MIKWILKQYNKKKLYDFEEVLNYYATPNLYNKLSPEKIALKAQTVLKKYAN